MTTPLDLAAWQAEVVAWNAHNFGDDKSRIEDALVVCEEAGELARAVLKQHQQIRGTYDEWQGEIAKEVGDVVITLASLAANAGLSLQDCIADRWAVVGARDFTANKIGHGLPKDDAA